MAKKKPMTLQVHRAVFHETVPWNLSDLLETIKASDEVGNAAIDREYWRKIAVKFPSFPKTNEAVAMQIALYEEGAEASTIQLMETDDRYATDAVKAPEKSEFLEHEVVILAKGNYMVSCNLGNRLALLVLAIQELAERAGRNIPPGTLSFSIPPNTLTIERIRRIGVARIDLDIAAYLAGSDIAAGGAFGALFSNSLGELGIRQSEMIADLSIRPDSRKAMKMSKEESPRNEWLDRAAVAAYDDDSISSYSVVLKDGTTWEEKSLKLNKSVQVERQGTTFSGPHALMAALDYLGDLEKEGLLK